MLKSASARQCENNSPPASAPAALLEEQLRYFDLRPRLRRDRSGLNEASVRVASLLLCDSSAPPEVRNVLDQAVRNSIHGLFYRAVMQSC